MSAEIKANNGKIAKNTILLYIRMVFVLLISLYTTRLLFRVLGVVDYGVYNVVSGVVAMFGFLNTAMANGIQRFYNFNLGKEGEGGLVSVYNTSVRIQLLIAIIVFALLEAVGVWYINNVMVLPDGRVFAANIIFQLSAISLIFVISEAPYAGAVMAMERMDYFAIVSILDAVLKLALLFVLMHIADDKLILWGIIGLVIAMLNFLLYFVYCKKKFLFIRLTKQFNKQEFGAMLGFSGWNVFGTLSNMLKDQGVNMILNSFFGPVVNAARGIAYQISSALTSFITNNSIAVRPQLTQAYAQGNYGRTLNLMYAISKLNYYLLLILTIPVSFEINFILHVWLGDDVPEYVPIFAILVMATNLLENLRSPVSLVVHASGEMKKYQFWVSMVNVLTIPLSWIVLKLGANPESTFIVALLCSILAQIVAVFILRTIISFSVRDYLYRVISPCFVVTTVAVVLTWVFRVLLPQSVIASIGIIIIGALFSIGAAYLLGMNKEEKQMVKTMALGIINRISHK